MPSILCYATEISQILATTQNVPVIWLFEMSLNYCPTNINLILHLSQAVIRPHVPLSYWAKFLTDKSQDSCRGHLILIR